MIIRKSAEQNDEVKEEVIQGGQERKKSHWPARFPVTLNLNPVSFHTIWIKEEEEDIKLGTDRLPATYADKLCVAVSAAGNLLNWNTVVYWSAWG